jgi:hypothetical protein
MHSFKYSHYLYIFIVVIVVYYIATKYTKKEKFSTADRKVIDTTNKNLSALQTKVNKIDISSISKKQDIKCDDESSIGCAVSKLQKSSTDLNLNTKPIGSSFLLANDNKDTWLRVVTDITKPASYKDGVAAADFYTPTIGSLNAKITSLDASIKQLQNKTQKLTESGQFAGTGTYLFDGNAFSVMWDQLNGITNIPNLKVGNWKIFNYENGLAFTKDGEKWGNYIMADQPGNRWVQWQSR